MASFIPRVINTDQAFIWRARPAEIGTTFTTVHRARRSHYYGMLIQLPRLHRLLCSLPLNHTNSNYTVVALIIATSAAGVDTWMDLICLVGMLFSTLVCASRVRSWVFSWLPPGKSIGNSYMEIRLWTFDSATRGRSIRASARHIPKGHRAGPKAARLHLPDRRKLRGPPPPPRARRVRARRRY